MSVPRAIALALMALSLLACEPEIKVKYRNLYIAVQEGDAEDVEKHLRLGAKVNETNVTYSWTPLHKAVTNGDAEVVRILLQYDADPSLKDKYGKTPRDYAVEKGDTEILALLPAPEDASGT